MKRHVTSITMACLIVVGVAGARESATAPPSTLAPAFQDGRLEDVNGDGRLDEADGWTPDPSTLAPRCELKAIAPQEGEARSVQAAVPKAEGRARWLSRGFKVDTQAAHELHAWVAAEGAVGGTLEIYGLAYDASGTSLGLLGKGQPDYGEAAGVYAADTQPWRQRMASIVPARFPAGTAYVCVAIEASGAGKGVVSARDITWKTAPVTWTFAAPDGGASPAGDAHDFGLYEPGETPAVKTAVHLAEAALGDAFDVVYRVTDGFGKEVTSGVISIPLAKYRDGETVLRLDSLREPGYYSVAFEALDAKGVATGFTTVAILPEGQVAPGLDPASPYGICQVTKDWQMRLSQIIGIKWVRGGMGWGPLEPRKGDFRFAQMDQKLAELGRYGLSQLGLIMGIPDWAQRPTDEFISVRGGRARRPKGRASLPKDLTDFEYFTKRLAEHNRADSAGGVPRYYEIWNEADIIGFWQGTDEEYVELLKAGSRGLKAGDPNCVVLMDGITAGALDREEHKDPRSGKVVERGHHIRQVFEKAANTFDAINFHGYGPLEKHSARYDLLDAFQREFKTHKPVWITEIGLPNQQPGGATLLETARYLVRSYVLARERGVEKYFWFRIDDWGRDATYNEHNFGLCTVERRPKPALAAYANLVRTLGAAKSPVNLGDPNKIVSTYRFATERGDATVLWGEQGTAEATVELTPARPELVEEVRVSSVLVHSDQRPAETMLDRKVDTNKEKGADAPRIINMFGGSAGTLDTSTSKPFRLTLGRDPVFIVGARVDKITSVKDLSPRLAPVGPANLILNPSFEIDLDENNDLTPEEGWRATHSSWRDTTGRMAWDTSVAHTGGHSVRIEGVTTQLAWQTNPIDLAPGHKYRVTVWTRAQDLATDGTVKAVFACFSDGKWVGNAKPPATAEVAGDHDWAERSYTVKPDDLPAEAKQFSLILALSKGGPDGKAWFDDARVEDIP